MNRKLNFTAFKIKVPMMYSAAPGTASAATSSATSPYATAAPANQVCSFYCFLLSVAGEPEISAIQREGQRGREGGGRGRERERVNERDNRCPAFFVIKTLQFFRQIRVSV